MTGYIKLHRKILDNPVVCKDAEYYAVWNYLLLNATHTEYDAIFKGGRITLKPGQLITGRKAIAEKFNISESKVQRVLKTFENEQQIEQQTTNKNRLITIINWKDYQSGEQQNEQLLNNNRTTSEQQLNTNKNVKNVKNNSSINNVEFSTIEKIVELVQESFKPILNASEIEMIEIWAKSFDFRIIKQALLITKRRDKKSLSYTNGILKNWDLSGVKTIDDLKIYESSSGPTLEDHRYYQKLREQQSEEQEEEEYVTWMNFNKE